MASSRCPFLYVFRWLVFLWMCVWWPVSALLWCIFKGAAGELTKGAFLIPFKVLNESLEEVAQGRWP